MDEAENPEVPTVDDAEPTQETAADTPPVPEPPATEPPVLDDGMALLTYGGPSGSVVDEASGTVFALGDSVVVPVVVAERVMQSLLPDHAFSIVSA